MESLSNPLWIKFARAIVDGVLHKRSFPDDFNRSQLFHFAEKNNLLFAVGQALSDYRPFAKPYELKMSNSEAQFAGTNQLVNELWPQFENEGLYPLTLKTFLPFPYVDSNIDCICIPSGSQSTYMQNLESQGFRWRKNLADIREPLKRMYAKTGADAHFPNYHLHTAVSWNGIHYIDLQSVWDSRKAISIAGHSVWIPCPSDELLIFAAHALFENKYITLHELIYLAYLEESGIDWERVKRLAIDKNWWSGCVWVLSLAQRLCKALSIPFTFPFADEDVVVQQNWHLPYQLPLSQTWSISWEKFNKDKNAANLQKIVRQLFSYSLVDPFWMMRKSRKKCRI